jgi:hypothetical protein
MGCLARPRSLARPASNDATRELLQSFKNLYPDFQLEDELFEEAGRDVMIGITY